MSKIEISGNYYFSPWVMAASMLFAIFSIAFPLDGAFISFVFTPLSGFSIAIVGLLQLFYFCFSKEMFEFDPTTKKYRKGLKLFSYRRGDWRDFDIERISRIAFQRYEESIEYNFGGIFNFHDESDIYELRLIKKDETFEAIVNASDFKSIAKMVKLGNAMSQSLGVPFYDYVRDLICKKRVG